jgi:hypothetical protein
MKKIGIMQPYFFPYIGYFQLINSVDEFIIYDNIQYTKKGWFNRNRILVDGKDYLITLPFKKDSDYLDISERKISENWEKDRKKILNVIKHSYSKSPFFDQIFPLIEKILNNKETNSFKFIYDSILEINKYLEIKTPIIISSKIEIDHSKKSQDKVLELCKSRNGKNYINSIGGIDLYDKEVFLNEGIKLNFIKSNFICYKQFNHEFVPWLSIIDVMMFNSLDNIKEYINQYTLI